MELRQKTLEIDAPTAECGHCHFTTALDGAWSVEDGRLVFRSRLNPLTRRGPGYESCCESSPVVEFRRITAGGVPLTDEQVTELRAAATSPEAWDEEQAADAR
jgi:hypothetical protein